MYPQKFTFEELQHRTAQTSELYSCIYLINSKIDGKKERQATDFSCLPIVAPDSGLELQKKRSATYENFRYLKSCFHFQRLAPQPLKASISVLRIYLLGYRAFRKIRELFLRIQVVSNYWLSQLFQSNTNYIINSVQKIQHDNFFEHLL
jgi:hypothetical protein